MSETDRAAAQELASKGRFGDTMLMHVNPIEVQMLHENSPGGLTINPETGQPEAFLPLLAGLAAGYLGPSIGISAALGAGLGTFGGSMLQGDDFKTAALSGALSFGLGSMFQAAGGAGDAAGAAGSQAATQAAGATAAEQAAAQTLADGAMLSGAAPTNISAPMGYGGPSVGGQAWNQVHADRTMGEKFLAIGDRIADPNVGVGGVLKDTFTGDPIGTAAAGIGLLGGGGQTLTGTDAYSYGDYGVGQGGKRNISRSNNMVAPEYKGQPGEDYRPGVDPEYTYFGNFTQKQYAEGGGVRPAEGPNMRNISGQRLREAMQTQQYANGGQVTANADNPVVKEAIAAILGSHPEPEVAVQRYVSLYGEEAFMELRQHVSKRSSEGTRQQGGLAALDGRKIEGPGTGMSDDIPAMIDGQQPAAMSTGEYVVPADVVSAMGDGDTDAGVNRMDSLVDDVRVQKTGRRAQPAPLNPTETLQAAMA